MRRELDYVYRMPAFTRRANAPPEMIIQFTRRCIKDWVLKASQGKHLEYQGKAIKILEDISWKVRQLRKQYEFLTKTLRDADIIYKRIYPEGLIFSWEGKNQKIDSVEKAEKKLHIKMQKNWNINLPHQKRNHLQVKEKKQ